MILRKGLLFQPKYGTTVRVDLERHTYQNGFTALLLSKGGNVYAFATINVPEVKLEPDEVVVKDYSENEGMLKFLVDNEIVKQTEYRIEMGFVTAPVCKLLV